MIDYSVACDKANAVTGTVSGADLSATAPTGTNIDGTLDETTGALYGTWRDATTRTSPGSGTFYGKRRAELMKSPIVERVHNLLGSSPVMNDQKEQRQCTQ